MYPDPGFPRTAAVGEADWKRLWELFHAAVDVPAPARSAWLDANVADPGTRAELDTLLAAHEREGVALDRPAVPASEEPGRRIGAWRLVRELGRGGMGTVWLAEREEGGFTQRAALKFVATPFAQPALVARFRRERQILAALSHPDIARMLDGGVSNEGVPWLAMEFVDGEALERWARERAPSLRERLALVVQLCGAVHYAHQHLIVHRDIKPGNVLVVDGKRPVLLDFGIAKLLEETGDPERTGTAMPAVFTPRYASPEQLLGEPVGTASDVYSLGLVLYELLAGSLPHAASGESWRELVTNVTNRVPPPPSQRGGTLPIERELDAIVLMALRREPERRYGSAAAFADDIQRYLDLKPVRARPDSAAYRTAKFVRRHRLGVALGAVGVVALGALGVRLAIESERANAALVVSQRERGRAEDTVAFLTDIFREADPTRGDGSNVSARDVLERGVKQLDARQLDPASRAAVLTALGETFANAGAYARAEALFGEAATLAQGVERSDALRGDALHGLGGAQQAAAKSAAARETLLQALALREDAYGADSIEVAATSERLGGAEQALAHFDAARAAFERTLAIRRAKLPADDPRIADVLLRLGSVSWSMGRYDDAEPYYRGALDVRRRHPGQAAELARALDAMGALGQVRGRYDEAEPYYREALELRRKVLGPQHRLTADTLGNLGSLAYERGDANAALPLLQEALAIQEQALGPDSPVVAKALNNLALTEAALGRRADARAQFERALAINRKAFGEKHVRVAGNLNNLGLVLLDDGEAAAAEPDFAAAAAIIEQLAGAEDPEVAYSLSNRARALVELDRFDEADALYARALKLRREHLDPAHPSVTDTLTWYGVLKCERGDVQAGAAMLEEALEGRRAKFGDAHASTAMSGALLGACLARQGGTDRSRELLLAYAQRVRDDPASGVTLLKRIGMPK